MVAFRPVNALPVDEAVVVTFLAGTPSAEGPRTTAKAVTFTGHTYAPLTLVRTDCGDQVSSLCEPGAELDLVFSNSLDPKTFDPKAVRISPEIPGGATITASGQTSSYRVRPRPMSPTGSRCRARVQDVFGQRLARAGVGHVDIAAATPRLDPFRAADHHARSDGRPAVDHREHPEPKRVPRTGVRVSTSDWPAFQRLYVSTAEQNFGQHTVLNVPGWPVLVDR